MTTLDLFDGVSRTVRPEALGPGAVVLRHFALSQDEALLQAIADVSKAAPFRNMTTPGGFRMSVAMTNCGELGWVTDRTGYRYDAIDPESSVGWPAMPVVFSEVARAAASAAGYPAFSPDACLVNRYEPGAKMSLHQDKNERDMAEPIVSVSLGLPAVFQFGGLERSDKPIRIPLDHGDVVVWGGPARLRFHGVMTLKGGSHTRTGAIRYNLTFRKAG